MVELPKQIVDSYCSRAVSGIEESPGKISVSWQGDFARQLCLSVSLWDASYPGLH